MDDLQMSVVKAIMRDSKSRRKRKAEGRQTPFDISADLAIEKAKKDLRLPTEDFEVRRKMINKFCENLEMTKPWECLDETFLGRRAFYEYRNVFVLMIASNLGITQTDCRKKKRVRKRANL